MTKSASLRNEVSSPDSATLLKQQAHQRRSVNLILVIMSAIYLDGREGRVDRVRNWGMFL